MIRLLNLIIFILVIVLLGIIIYPQWKENRPVTVHLGCDSTVSSTVWVVTNQKGFFTKEKIIPDFKYYSDPELMFKALINQEIHCAILPWSTLLKRVRLVNDSFAALASGEFRTSIPIDALFTSPTLKDKIKTIKDLKNRRLGYPSEIKDIMPAVIKNIGFKQNELKLIELPNSALISALQNNQVDAIIVIEPERTSAINTGLTLITEPILPKYLVAPFPGIAYVIKRDLLKTQPRIAYKLKLLLDGTVAFVDANVEESRAMFQKFYSLDTLQYKNMYLPQFQKMVEINKGAIISLMTKMADAESLATIDIQQFFVEAGRFKH